MLLMHGKQKQNQGAILLDFRYLNLWSKVFKASSDISWLLQRSFLRFLYWRMLKEALHQHHQSLLCLSSYEVYLSLLDYHLLLWIPWASLVRLVTHDISVWLWTEQYHYLSNSFCTIYITVIWVLTSKRRCDVFINEEFHLRMSSYSL